MNLRETILEIFDLPLIPPQYMQSHLSQETILLKIGVYLALLEFKKPTEERDFEKIKQFKEGYCSGISALWMYSRWLQTQPKIISPRDDYDWFQSTVKMIADWDINKAILDHESSTPLDSTLTSNLDRFTQYIQFFQHIDHHLPDMAQGDLDLFLEDDVGRKMKREYSIASLFTLNQLKDLIIRTENIIQDGRMILVSSHDHDTSIFRQGNYYYYYDPNNSEGEIRTISLDKLARFIFISNDFDYGKPSPLAFRMFSFDETPKAQYPTQKKVLKSILPSLDQADNDEAKGFTGLMIAASIGCLQSIKYFLEISDPDVKNADGNTALMMAIVKNRVDIVTELLEKSNPNLHGSNGDTALMLAAMFGYTDIIKILLPKANPNIRNYKTGQTALMHAVLNKQYDVVKLLLENGAKPNIVDLKNETALKKAIMDERDDIIELLLEKGANPNIYGPGKHTTLIAAIQITTDTDGKFDLSKIFLQKKIISMLLQKKADPNVLDSNNQTALMMAIRKGRIDIVEMLLKNGGDPNICGPDNYTPLMQAIAADNPLIIELLLQHGANPNVFNSYKNTALMMAVEKNNIDVIKLLLENRKIRTNPDLCLEDKKTALLIASMYGYYDAVKILLENNAKPDLKHKNGLSPLLHAIMNKNLRMVKELLKHGANPNIKDRGENTALMYAIEVGEIEIVKEILKQDIDLEAKNDEEYNALECAEEFPDTDDIVDLIKKKKKGTLIDYLESEIKPSADKVSTPLVIESFSKTIDSLEPRIATAKTTEEMDIPEKIDFDSV